LLKAKGIELARLNLDGVTGGPSLDSVASFAEALAKLRNIDLKRVGSGAGSHFPPDEVNESIARDDLIGVQQKQGEKGSLLGRTKLDHLTVNLDPQRSQYLKLHRLSRGSLGYHDFSGDDSSLEVFDGRYQVIDKPTAGGITNPSIGQPEHACPRAKLICGEIVDHGVDGHVPAFDHGGQDVGLRRSRIGATKFCERLVEDRRVLVGVGADGPELASLPDTLYSGGLEHTSSREPDGVKDHVCAGAVKRFCFRLGEGHAGKTAYIRFWSQVLDQELNIRPYVPGAGFEACLETQGYWIGLPADEANDVGLGP
jgi:hypothetical protein